MQFWDSFWPGVWGALVGALVGALASWVFALDLRRRDEFARAAEREADLAHAEARLNAEADLQYKTTLNRRVGELVFALKRYESDLARLPGIPGPDPDMNAAAARHDGAREAALTALLEAEFYTRGPDQRVIQAVRRGLDGLAYAQESSMVVGVVAQLLVTWRTEGKSAEWAIAGVGSWTERPDRAL